MISPAAAAGLATDVLALAAKHPTIAKLVFDVVRLALTGEDPWRRVIRHILRVAGTEASDELANELGRLENVIKTPPSVT